MVEPVILLIFAWSIGSLMSTMKTPDYLVESLGDSIPEEAIAGLSFIISALTSFFIGTSWGKFVYNFTMHFFVCVCVCVCVQKLFGSI